MKIAIRQNRNILNFLQNKSTQLTPQLFLCNFKIKQTLICANQQYI